MVSKEHGGLLSRLSRCESGSGSQFSAPKVQAICTPPREGGGSWCKSTWERQFKCRMRSSDCGIQMLVGRLARLRRFRIRHSAFRISMSPNAKSRAAGLSRRA